MNHRLWEKKLGCRRHNRTLKYVSVIFISLQRWLTKITEKSLRRWKQAEELEGLVRIERLRLSSTKAASFRAKPGQGLEYTGAKFKDGASESKNLSLFGLSSSTWTLTITKQLQIHILNVVGLTFPPSLSHLFDSAVTPGSSLPSSNSRDAQPYSFACLPAQLRATSSTRQPLPCSISTSLA